MRHDDLVALADVLIAPRLRDQIDRLGRTAHEQDLFRRRRADETLHGFACMFISIRGAARERMGCAMDVRVLVLVEIRQPVDHRARLLRGRRVVEPDQLPAVDAFLQDGEVTTNGVNIERKVTCRNRARTRVRTTACLLAFGIVWRAAAWQLIGIGSGCEAMDRQQFAQFVFTRQPERRRGGRAVLRQGELFSGTRPATAGSVHEIERRSAARRRRNL